MIELLCDNCNGVMTLDYNKTLEQYSRELGYTVLSGGELDPETIQDYAVYKCTGCFRIKKLTLNELEFQIRRSVAVNALALRAIKVLRELPDEARTYDSKVFYCGKCAGVVNEKERDGYCLESVAKYCSIYKGRYI